jgi:proline dehydrogenase
MGSQALKKAALNEEAKEYILKNEVLFKILKKAANRYIGGETLEETIQKVMFQNKAGFKCSIEFMGESTKTEDEANDATKEFIRICQEIQSRHLHSTVSLDLSHIGLAISGDLCYSNFDSICTEAAKGGIEVVVSAEGMERTEAIIGIYRRAARVHKNIAITLQAYLYRTKDDFQDLIKEKGRIRIVKGAFETVKGVSLPRGKELDERYLEYVGQLLSSQHLCSIATHHSEIQQEVKKLIRQYNASKDSYEFESLYGIQTGQLERLKEEGYPAKMYFVYGKEWLLYVCNRISEYPLNLFRALNDIVEPGIPLTA